MRSNFDVLRAACAFALTLISCSAWSDTVIDGSNSTLSTGTTHTWTEANSPYIIQSNVQVNNNSTLVIEAGVTVKFDGAYILAVDSGTLTARGTADKKITFTSNSSTAVAARIRFITSAVDATFNAGTFVSGSILEHAIVEKIGGPNGALEIQGATPFLANNVFRNNISNGVNASDITTDLRIVGNEFSGNTAKHGGGLLMVAAAGSTVTIQNNLFSNNTALLSGGGDGGGSNISTFGAITMSSNTFVQNKAQNNGGGLYIFGPNTSTAMLSGNVFRENTVVLNGAGIAAKTIGVTFDGDTIVGNRSTSGFGGGLYSSGSVISMTRSLVEGNVAHSMGGGMYLNSPTNTITYSVIANNTSTTSHSGGIDLHGEVYGGSQNTIDHCVIAGNSSTLYGSGVGFSMGTGTITNSTLVQNRGVSTVQVFSFNNGLPTNLSNNTLTQNTSTFATISYYPSSNSSMLPTLSFNGSSIRFNNLFGNSSTWDVYNNFCVVLAAPIPPNCILGVTGDVTSLDASSNWWGTTNDALIAPRLGLVDPTATVVVAPKTIQHNTLNPISPPTGVTVTAIGNAYRVQWNANPEGDTAGYRVHYGTRGAPYFENTVDVGLVTSYDIAGLDGGDYFVAVTAYDSNIGSDSPTTPVNENQTAGYESWYSAVKPMIVVDVDLEVAVTAVSNFTPNNVMKTNEPMLFKVSVTNHGPSSSVSSTVVEVEIPAGFEATASANCALTANSTPETTPTNLTCTLPAIGLNETFTEDILATVKTMSTNSVTVAAEITASDTDANSTNNSATYSFVVNRPDVALSWEQAPTSGAASSAITYRINAKNLSRVAASNLAISIAVPANTSAASSVCIVSGATITCSAASLPTYNSGQSFEFTLTPSTEGSITVDATMTVAEPEMSLTNNAVSATTTVGAKVDNVGDPEQPVTETKKKKGGGAIELLWLVFLVAGYAALRRQFPNAAHRA